VSAPRRVAIVGGGIAGLSTAYALEKAAGGGARLEVRLFEAGPAPGGVIRTERRDGFLLDTGPDSLFKGKPAAIDLARELGMGSELLEASRQELPTLIYSRGRLRPLPAGLEMLSPTRVLPFLLSGLITPSGKARMFMEPFIRAKEGEEDESVASFIGRRFGAEAAEKIAGPLFAGIHAGDPERLSIRSTFPRLVEMERKHGSLAAAIRKMRGSSGAPGKPASSSRPGPPFVSFKGGIRRIVDGVLSALKSTRIETACEIGAVGREGGGFVVRMPGRDPWSVEACVVAVPAPRAAALIEGIAPRSASALRRVRYASSATVFLGFRARDVSRLPGATGFLIPFTEKRRIFGCTFVSNKFQGRAPDGCVLLRAFVGGAVDEATAETPDDEMLATVRREIAALIGLTAEPILSHVVRWTKANPQYEIGHGALVEEIDEELQGLPGLVVTGSGFRGVGIPDGVVSGREAARKVMEHLASTTP